MVSSRYTSIIRSGLLALMMAALAGCGGGGGGSGGGGGGNPPPATGNFDGSVALGGGSITSFTVESPPVITFKLEDSVGNPVVPGSLNQVRFALAKFVPGTPERWIPFGTKVNTPDPAKFMYTNENRNCGQTGDGWAFANVKYDASTAVYTYYFCTDVTQDANWDAGATYRIGAELQYNDPVTATVRTSNPIVDFTLDQGIGQQVKDGSGNGTLVREMVARESCNTCHNDLGQQSKFHGNRRIEPSYCVLCHNDSAFDPATAESLDLKFMVHKFHMGSHLTGSYAPSGLDATKMHFSQDLRNCNKCHSSTPAEGNPFQTAQGDNWKTVPSRSACGSCHDGINFATGGGTTLNPDLPWASLGHVGGAQANDALCSNCHGSDAIANIYHIPVTAITSGSGVTTHYAANDNRLPAGAKTVDYEIQSVSLNGSRNPVMVFRILQSGARLDLRTPSSTADTAIWDNFVGAPNIYFAYSIPQDGVAAPADFNAYVNTNLQGIWNGSGTGTNAGTLTGPDANGFYTLTLTGRVIPVDASMLTGALGYSAMYQTNVAGYERTCGSAPCSNGLNVTAQDVSMTASGFTERRVTVETERCNNCHGKLGLFTEFTFHSGQRNDPKMCAMCHNPNRSSSGWSADSTAFVHGIHGGSKRSETYNWHSIVTLPDGSSVSSGTALTGTEIVQKYGDIGFPGNLSNCLNCHDEGGYDFSAGGSQVASRLHRTAAQGNMAAAGTVGTLSLSPYVTPGQSFGSSISNCSSVVNCDQPGTHLVNSPIANACFSCHDGDTSSMPGLTVEQHIETQGGGSIYEPRSTALLKQETCLLCHGPNGIAPIKAAHGL